MDEHCRRKSKEIQQIIQKNITMKSTELMIGDWVSVNGRLVLVSDINDTTIGYFDEEILLSDVKPIPLTTEILEKNGFIKETRIMYHITDKNWNFLKIECHKPDFYIGKGCDEDECLLDFATIHYVHELQHVLKLCGIDKNIEL